MDDSLSQALIRLPKDAVRRLSGRSGDGIAVFEGQIWITQDGVPGDVVVSFGESHDFDGDGDVVLQALVDTVLIHTRPIDRVVDGHRSSSRVEAPPTRISAFALAQSARRMRDAAVGRAIARAAGAAALASARLLFAIARGLRRHATAVRHAGRLGKLPRRLKGRLAIG